MQELQLIFDKEGINFGPEDAKKSAAEITYEVLKGIILSSCQSDRGFGEEDRRKYYKVCDAIEAVISNDDESVRLEDAEAKFIRSCRSKAKLMPNKLTQRIEELIDNMKEVDVKER